MNDLPNLLDISSCYTYFHSEKKEEEDGEKKGSRKETKEEKKRKKGEGEGVGRGRRMWGGEKEIKGKRRRKK